MKKKLVSLLVCLALLTGIVPANALASQEGSDANFINLVVFCKFAGEDEFVNNEYAGASVRRIVDNTYNNSVYSTADYFSTVSGGKMKIKTLYLLDGDSSLTLSRPRTYYANNTGNPNGYASGEELMRRTELMRDWGEAVNAAIKKGCKPTDINGNVYSFADLDKDKDGEIDLITVMYKQTTQSISVNPGDPLWDYETRSTMVNVSENGKTYTSGEYVQLTCQYTDFNNNLVLYRDSSGKVILGSPGKICHETMHALGPKDLYASSSYYVVGFMSLMGKHTSPVGQYITAKERESLGWIDNTRVKTMADNGTYTLKLASAENGVVAYKKALPTNKTLYLEYRRFDEKSNKYDQQTKSLTYIHTDRPASSIKLKSGLVCYLVDSDIAFPSNLNSRYAQMDVVSYGSEDTNSDCAVGLDQTLNTIYNGTGWVSVTVTAMTDSELTFSITGLPKAENGTLSSITINGDSAAVIPTTGKTDISLTADAAYTSGTEADITDSAVWSVVGNYPGVSVSSGTVSILPSAAAGTVTIKAEYNGKSNSHTITLSKKTQHEIGSFASAAVNITYGDTVTGQTVASSTGTVHYSSSDPSAVAVDPSTGALTVHKAKNVTITAEVPADGTHTANSTSYVLNVAKKELQITGISAVSRDYSPNEYSVTLSGGTLSGKVGGDDVSVTMPTTGTVASDNAGKNRPVAVATPVLKGADADNYTLKQISSITVNINKADPSIGTVTHTGPATIYPNTALSDIILTKTGTTAGTLKLVDGQSLSIGTNSYRWTFTPTDENNYNPANGTISLTVTASPSVPPTTPGGNTEGGGNVGSTGGGNAGSAAPSETYHVTVKPVGNGGTATVSSDSPEKGDTVTVTVKADSGFFLGKITAADSTGKPLQITEVKTGTFTFNQPESDVTIWVVFNKTELPAEKREWTAPYSDVANSAWYFEPVKFAYEYGLMSGTSPSSFTPNSTADREQFVTVLWRLAGSPKVEQEIAFTDVNKSEYYAEAVRWAVNEGIVGGYGDGKFGVGDEITREQLATMLHRYAKSNGSTADSPNIRVDYTDFHKVSAYANEAITWCSLMGVINGYEDNSLIPQGTATRAEMAQIFMNFTTMQAAESR